MGRIERILKLSVGLLWVIMVITTGTLSAIAAPPKIDGEKLAAIVDGSKNTTEKAFFDGFKNQVTTSIEAFKTYGAKECFTVMQDNIDAVKELRKKVENDNLDEHIDDIATTFTAVAASSRQIVDSLWPDIQKVHNNEFMSLDNLQSVIKAKTDEIDSEINILQGKTASAEKALKNESNPYMKKKLEADLHVDRMIIKSKSTDAATYHKFVEALKLLQGRLGDTVQKIDLLLYVLKRNAELYEAAAKTAMIRSSAANVIQCLVGVKNVDEILGDIQNSWQDVDAIMEVISSADFNFSLPIDGHFKVSQSDPKRS